ncbi:MAG TPA: nucleoside hydrolase [Anaerolineaceae bacterium]|nr:nucleoside hydrolase [Anaerolineaceae bacterium]
MKKERFILDTDPGIDDALTILYALASPEVKMEAITIVNGNCPMEQGTINALSVLELMKTTHIPVAKGMARPLLLPVINAEVTHGKTGLGYAELPAPMIKPDPRHAVELIRDLVLQDPGELNIVAIGPLTNIAMTVRLYPEIVGAVKHIYIMGGAINHCGNMTPQAEFNIYCDPHAAHVVFHSGIPFTLVPLDVTYQVLLTGSDLLKIEECNTPISDFIVKSSRYVMEYLSESQEVMGCALNDPLALAAMFQPDLLTMQHLVIDVDPNEGVSMGKTFADFYNYDKKKENGFAALDVQARLFVERFLERMTYISQ